MYLSYRETATRIKFNMVDETAKDDAAFDISHSPTYQWCDLDTLTTGGESSNYLTNEHNYCILDGSINDIDYVSPIGAPTYAFVSNFISNGNRTFDSTYYLRIIFDNAHTSNGITITFDNDFLPDKIRVEYYDSTNNNHNTIYAGEYNVDENIFFCNSEGTVENYKEIRIYFISTQYPYSLIKISKIEFGVDYTWGDGGDKKSSLLNAEIFEEADIISNTLSIGTCRFTVYSDDDDFNIDNPKNIYSSIKVNQSLYVYEIIRNYDDNSRLIGSPQEIFMGKYFVKKWDAREKHSIEFECVDLIGLLDDIPFYESRALDKNTFGDTISWIKDSINMGNDIIQLQSGLSTKHVNGILPVCTCREALQMACFAINAYATCNRRENIYVSIKDNYISHTIPDENNFGIISSKISPFVTGIKYPSFVYTSIDTPRSVFCEKQVSTGQKTFIIDNMTLPSDLANISVNTTQGTARGNLVNIINISGDQFFKNAHKIVINVTRAGNLIINGFPAEKNLKTFIKKIEGNFPNDNIIDISNINLYQTVDATSDDIAIIDKLLEYYSNRNICEYEFLLTGETSGNWCVFKNMYDEYVIGNIFNMSIDLTGGFIAKTKLVCCRNLDEMNRPYISGNELICGENSGDNIGII